MAIVIVALCIVYFGFVRQTRTAALSSPPARSSFPNALIQSGAQLAALGDCTVCHTTAGGKSFAGGLPIETPFGTIYSTNITPDPQTGIGLWSEDALRRAMREGVAQNGSYLYPAFPYDHFTKVSDQDIHAIYAYLMTREPVRQENRRNDLRFPINIRTIMWGWNLLFLTKGPVAPQSDHDAQWNHGRYLVEGLGHCGACHSPRNAFGAEQADRAFEGGEAEGWLAPALDSASPDPEPWTARDFYTYLKTGFTATHSFAAGPMGPVVLDLQRVSDSDVRDMAAYMASLQPKDAGQPSSRARDILSRATAPGLGLLNDKPEPPASEIYASACGWCHYNAAGSNSFFASRQKLALGLAANAPTPANLLHVILDGIPPATGSPSPIMPGFRGELSRSQLAELANYIRGHFTDKPPWTNVEGEV